jgi:hypothetical protein
LHTWTNDPVAPIAEIDSTAKDGVKTVTNNNLHLWTPIIGLEIEEQSRNLFAILR